MESGTNFSNIRHAQQFRSKLNSQEGLPFSDVLSSETIANSITTYSTDCRDRVFTTDIVLWTFLPQVINKDQSCQAAVARTISFLLSHGKPPPSANTAAYCKARFRLLLALLMSLARTSGLEMEKKALDKWLWRGRHVKLMDGSTVSMPDTPQNQAEYPQPDSQKPGIGFPIARLVAIIFCATGSVLDLALGPYQGKCTGEHALLRELMQNFDTGDVALGDCYYCTFFLIASLMKMGVDAVFPMHGARDCDFRKGERLGKKDHLVDWVKPQKPAWMDNETYESYPETITVREAEVCFEKNGFPTEKRVLVTTFLKPKKVTTEDLRDLYDKRWLVEIDLKAIKTTMQMDILRGRTPEIMRKEIWAHLLAYNLIRKVMAQAACAHNKTPRQLSFSLARQMIDAFREKGLFCEGNYATYAHLLKAIAHQTVGDRPGRSEPRAVKRRPKAFPRLTKRRSYYKREMA
jgi:hypothetical protein